MELRWTAALACLVLASCESYSRAFRPTEKVNSESPSGQPAALYDLGRENQRWGEGRDGPVTCFTATASGSCQVPPDVRSLAAITLFTHRRSSPV